MLLVGLCMYLGIITMDRAGWLQPLREDTWNFEPKVHQNLVGSLSKAFSVDQKRGYMAIPGVPNHMITPAHIVF